MFELVVEWHVFVETVRGFDACRECGQRVVSGGRHVIQVRDLPVGPKATRLVWHKREWRCRDCGRSWREQHSDIAPRAVLIERARAEAARQVATPRHRAEQWLVAAITACGIIGPVKPSENRHP